MIIGYARKSTHLQDVTHQVDELTKAGCEQIYHEQISRGGTKRAKNGAPELENCLKALREGDTLVVWAGTVAKLAMRQPFVLFKGLTFQKLCLP
ncbi:recombinase family protein, partial [Escherichia coli]|uniref:recombinase family protein n=1 Tax=Escherichia coli TaxID=562 RepID=UPI00201B021D